MMKHNSVCRRGLSLLLAIVLMFGMCVQTVQAADESNVVLIEKNGLKVTYDWKENESMGVFATKTVTHGEDSIDATVYTGQGTKVSSFKRTGKLTITIKNLYSGKADLRFHWQFPGAYGKSYGSVSIDGSTLSGQSGDFQKKGMSEGETVAIVIESAYNKYAVDPGLHFIISGILMDEITSNVTVKFYRPEGSGSYTVENLTDGTKDTITASSPEYTKMTKPANHKYKLVATPAQNHVFVGWKNESGAYIEGGATLETTFTEDIGIRPVFVPDTYSQYSVEDHKFFDLNEANAYAVKYASNKTIVLLNNGILPENATISPGVTLLIPYNDSASVNASATPDAVDSGSTQKVFRTLTIPSGVTLTVYGALNVNGQVLKLQSLPTGPYGLITLSAGGKIVLKKASDGTAGKLYCWGYINGQGTIEAENGTKVYECFQLRGWRGGSVSLNELNNNKYGVFLVNQYYIQNIEATLELNYGAEEYVYASVTVSGGVQASTTEMFIGKGKGMFQLQEEGSKIVKKYNHDRDRMEFEISGRMLISSMSLKLAPKHDIAGILAVQMDTRDYVLPIHGGFSVNIRSGTTTIDGPDPSVNGDTGQRVCWLPGSELTVAYGAALNVNSEMYIYDRDQWAGKGYGYVFGPGNCDFASVTYATSRTPRTASSVVDAKVDVNGTIYVNGVKGKLYTTKQNSTSETDGANITSSQGTGKIVFNSAPDAAGTTTQTHQYVQGASSPFSAINCDPAKLRNANDKDGNEQFTLTAGAQAGWTYTYLTEALSANPEKYKDMWYLFKVTYVDVASGKSEVKYITTDSDSFKVPGADASSILKAETKKGTATCSFEGSTLNVSGINAGEDRECTIWITNTKQEFTIKFDGNEPESGKLSGSTNSMTVPMSETTVTLPDCGFTATGWKFVGWSLKKDTAASSTELLKTSATQGQLGNPAAGDEVTLYAIWQPDKVYSVTVSWSKGLEYTYIPNEYTWNATEMRYEHTREAGWIGANDSNPTVTISNGGDKTDVTYGHINAGIQYTPNDAAYNGFTMDFLVDNMSMGKGSATLATKLAPKNSVTTTMKLEGTPFIGMDTGKPITIGTVALTLTTAD